VNFAGNASSAGSLGMKPRVNLMLVALAVAMTLPRLVGAMDGVVMKDGRMMMMKGRQGNRADDRRDDMPDGTKVTTSVVVKMREGGRNGSTMAP
jgi:hypothetical protein